MVFMILTSSLLVFVLTVISLRKWGAECDTMNRRVRGTVREEKQQLYEELEKSFADRFIKPVAAKIAKFITSFIPQSKRKTKKKDNKQLELLLRRAGISLKTGEYTAYKAAFMLGVAVLSVIFSFVLTKETNIRLVIIIFGLTAAVALPTLFIRNRVNKRRLSIQHQLPDVMDILMVSVEAGLGLDEAIIRVSEKMSGVIIDEFLRLRGELQMGAPRKEAFEHLGECSDLQELKTFTSAMVQAEQLGIPIKNVLKTQSQAMRVSRKQTAQEKGQKAPVKMIIPMVIFILPVLFIILMGPVVIQLIELFA